MALLTAEQTYQWFICCEMALHEITCDKGSTDMSNSMLCLLIFKILLGPEHSPIQF